VLRMQLLLYVLPSLTNAGSGEAGGAASILSSNKLLGALHLL
jgi:hypothetical protein